MKGQTQLFILHFAGGNCYSFQFLNKHLSGSFDIYSLELPGRGKRIKEDLIFDFNKAVIDYYNQIKKLRNNHPYVIYGHSMGALIGAYVAKRFESDNDPPKKIILTGSAGPNIKLREKRYLLPEKEFKDELIKMGGMPQEIIESKELFDFFNPILRADFQLLEKQETFLELELESDLFVIMGRDERYAGYIENWKSYTIGKITLQLVEGNHFFIYKKVEEVVKLIYQQ